MSHTVTVTRTTTTTTTSAIILNTGYLKTLPGLLKVLEVIISAICLALLIYYRSSYYFSEFFLCVLTAVLVGSTCLLLSCILSISTASMIAKTMYELIYHFVAFILCLAASITLMVEVNRTSKYSSYYNPYLTASILGFVLTILYLVSMVFSYRSYRGL
uniref:Putative members of chemokine-like factor super family n=1 Tax=Panstrongylus lignarius TaxID=156445 RepID=A0A224XRP8_9HEMI